MSRGIKFSLSKKLYVRDPQETKYGKRLLRHSIILMDQLGLEQFTFKKLASEMKSTEASIYRYFENKYKMLSYLGCWYWEWVHYLIDIHTLNIKDPKHRLQLTIHQLIHASNESVMTEYINENALHRLLIREGVKVIHFQDVDQAKEQGLFKSKINLIEKVSDTLLQLNPDFAYHRTLASTIIDMVDNQIYYAHHLPQLSSLSSSENTLEHLEQIVNDLTFSTLASSKTAM